MPDKNAEGELNTRVSASDSLIGADFANFNVTKVRCGGQPEAGRRLVRFSVTIILSAAKGLHLGYGEYCRSFAPLRMTGCRAVLLDPLAMKGSFSDASTALRLVNVVMADQAAGVCRAVIGNRCDAVRGDYPCVKIHQALP